MKVTSIPDVLTMEVEPDDDFIIIGSDGVFDVLSSQVPSMLLDAAVAVAAEGAISRKHPSRDGIFSGQNLP